MSYQIEVFKAIPTVSTSPAYTSGDVFGTKLTVLGANSISRRAGYVTNVLVGFKDPADVVGIDLALFDADPASSTFTDNAAFSLHDDDMQKLIAVMRLDATNFNAAANAHMVYNVATMEARVPFITDRGEALYGALICRGTPTLASTSDIGLRVIMELCE